jgi:hypothetical protein
MLMIVFKGNKDEHNVHGVKMIIVLITERIKREKIMNKNPICKMDL